MLRWMSMIVAVVSLGITAFADDDRPRKLAILAVKQDELDRLAKEVVELEQQLDRPTQISLRFQMISVTLPEWEQLIDADVALQEPGAVNRTWLKRLADLQRKKKAVELSNSNVLTNNGKAARYVSGGEFPVPVPAPGTQDPGQMTVQWREFGNIVEVLPILKGDGRIDLQMSAEHSVRDTNTEIKINKIKVPGLIRTRFTSRATMQFGETYFVARGKRDDHMVVLLVTPERVK